MNPQTSERKSSLTRNVETPPAGPRANDVPVGSLVDQVSKLEQIGFRGSPPHWVLVAAPSTDRAPRRDGWSLGAARCRIKSRPPAHGAARAL